MSIEKIKEKLFREAVQDSSWLEDFKFRQENEAWLDMSFAIALKVLRTLSEQNMSQKDLAEAMQCSPQYINKIVKGSENLTLETISKLEKALNIKLISGPYSEGFPAAKPSSQQAQQ